MLDFISRRRDGHIHSGLPRLSGRYVAWDIQCSSRKALLPQGILRVLDRVLDLAFGLVAQLRNSNGHLRSAGVPHAADQPNDKENDQQGAENAPESSAAIAAVSVIPTTATKNQNQHHDQQYQAHDPPSQQLPVTPIGPVPAITF